MRHMVASAVACLVAAPLWAQSIATQGVDKSQITIGSIQDLSGPIAGFGKQIRAGMLLRVDEINEQGGINGRRLKLIVEDSSYDPKKAVLAAQKLVSQDRIFAMVAHLGTAQNMAAMPVQFEKGVINFFPISAAREMYEPFHRLKYAFAVPYFDQIREFLPLVAKEKGAKRVCAIYQDDDFGLEVVRGAEAALKSSNSELVERTSFKRGATDFSSQVARMKSSGCDFVVLGTLLRESIGTIMESRKIGFMPTFLGSSAAYTDLIPKLGGRSMDGMYAVMGAQHPYVDDMSTSVAFWAKKYKTKFSEDPTVYSVYGYTAVDAFALGARKAGASLTTESFVKAMDSISIPADMFGNPQLSFSATKRLGSPLSRLSQLQEGRWKVVRDYGRP